VRWLLVALRRHKKLALSLSSCMLLNFVFTVGV
jgi:hypothetical protein